MYAARAPTTYSTRAPPITPHTTATGYWRVHGFARDGTETLAFHPHTHTHITKPRAQHARACNMAHRLPWRTPLSSRTRGDHASQRDAQACNAVHTVADQHHSHNRPPDHSQPSPSTSVARPHERRPDEQRATQPRAPSPHASRATHARPRHGSRNRTAAQLQSPMRSFALSPARVENPMSTSTLQRAVDTLTTMASSLVQRVANFILPARRQSDARARQSTPKLRRFHTSEERMTPEGTQRNPELSQQIPERRQRNPERRQSDAKATELPPRGAPDVSTPL